MERFLPAAHADEGDNDTSAVPSHATKNPGLVVAYATRSTEPSPMPERAEMDAGLALSDHELEEALLLAPPPPFKSYQQVHPSPTQRRKRSQVENESEGSTRGEGIHQPQEERQLRVRGDEDDVPNEGPKEQAYRDPTAFVPRIVVYLSFSDDGNVDMISTDDAHVVLDEDQADDVDTDMDMDADMDVDRSNAKAKTKVPLKKKP